MPYACPLEWKYTKERGPGVGYGRGATQAIADQNAHTDAKSSADTDAEKKKASHKCDQPCTEEYDVRKTNPNYKHQQADPQAGDFVSTATLTWRLWIKCVEPPVSSKAQDKYKG